MKDSKLGCPRTINTGAFDTTIRALIAKHLAIDHRHISDEAEFLRDFAVDWLDRLELIIVLEDHFAIEFPDHLIDDVRSVGDLIRLVEAFAPPPTSDIDPVANRYEADRIKPIASG